MQKGDVFSTCADISNIKSLTKYFPKTSIEVGLKSWISWYEDYCNKVNC
jgi:nucleoside-diphosphate-sugar epimerase